MTEKIVVPRNKVEQSEFLSPHDEVHCDACSAEFKSGDTVFLLREYVRGESWWDSWILLATYCASCGRLRRDL